MTVTIELPLYFDEKTAKTIVKQCSSGVKSLKAEVLPTAFDSTSFKIFMQSDSINALDNCARVALTLIRLEIKYRQ